MNARPRVMKKVDRDPFSNGESYDRFDCRNCSGCIKNSVYDPKRDRYTNADDKNMPNRCAILRDIMLRMYSNTPISQRTIDVCENFTLHGVLCPYRKTERSKPKTHRPIKGQLQLFTEQ